MKKTLSCGLLQQSIDDQMVTSGTAAEDMGAYEQEAERVNNCIAQRNPDLSILLFADNHTYAREKYMKYSRIMSQGVIDYQIGLGDFVDYSHASKAVASKHLADCIQKAGKKPNCFYAYGNHDVGICGVNTGGTGLDVVMTPKENYTIFGAHLADNKNVVVDAKNPYGGYYFVDDEKSKIRMIILNTSDVFREENGAYAYFRYKSTLRVSQTQLTWFAETALSFGDKKNPSDWAVIVFGHEYNPYWGNLILLEILEAVQEGKAFRKTSTVYQRLAENGDGTYGPEVNTVHGDTYSVDVDYAVQGPVTVMGFIHGHNHVDTQSVICGINCIQVRCDSGELDRYYMAPCEAGLKGNFYFKDKSGHIYTFESSEIADAASIGYNYYWTDAKMTPAPISVFDKRGIRITSVSCKYSETVPKGAAQITGFVAERDGSSVANESCEVLCIDKESRTLTFVPYGTGTQRMVPYARAVQTGDRCSK